MTQIKIVLREKVIKNLTAENAEKILRKYVDRDVDRRIGVFVHVTPETKLGKEIKPVSDNYNGRLISMETAGRVVDGRLKAYVQVKKGKNIIEKIILFPFEAIRWDVTIIYHEQCA